MIPCWWSRSRSLRSWPWLSKAHQAPPARTVHLALRVRQVPRPPSQARLAQLVRREHQVSPARPVLMATLVQPVPLALSAQLAPLTY